MKKHKKSAKPKSRSSKWEYFEDCGICQAMKNAEKHDRDLSMEELKYAFKKQNSKNPWLKNLQIKSSNNIPKA